jgi:hypothetical protein
MAKRSKMMTRKGKKSGRKGTRKASPWNKFVKKIFEEGRRKNKGYSFSQALSDASSRKGEMKTMKE